MSNTLALLNYGAGLTMEIAELMEEHFSSECDIRKSKLSKRKMSYESKVSCGDAAATIEIVYNADNDVYQTDIDLAVEDPENDRHHRLVDKITDGEFFDPEEGEISLVELNMDEPED